MSKETCNYGIRYDGLVIFKGQDTQHVFVCVSILSIVWQLLSVPTSTPIGISLGGDNFFPCESPKTTCVG